MSRPLFVRQLFVGHVGHVLGCRPIPDRCTLIEFYDMDNRGKMFRSNKSISL